ncbi:hypothetical protein GCM10023092_22960 [Rurimicrobium arvi]|uniref:Peptidase M10 metallopeptidase domain-containing protein n=2 Tax=Rurimicrobium arvi TaxID=2049916 RepID=A0ABP8MVS0_9BACT
MNYFFGRWGYISVEPPAGGTSMYQIPSTDISTTITVDYTLAAAGYYFTPVTQQMAQVWSDATLNQTNIPHIIINVSSQNPGSKTASDAMNSIWLDQDGTYMTRNDFTHLAITFYRLTYNAKPNICNSQSRVFQETDIILHAFVTGQYGWVAIPPSTSNPHQGSGQGYNSSICYDYPSAILHELGHFLGLGHIKNNASTYSVMVETLPTNTIIRDLSPEDEAAIRFLYNRGLSSAGGTDPGDNIGFVSCGKWYTGNQHYVKCRTVPGLGDGLGSGDGCSSNQDNGGDPTHDHAYCYNDENGTTHAGFYCVFQNTGNKTPTNNFGISQPAVNNFNNYASATHPYDFPRSRRALIMVLENEELLTDAFTKYERYTTGGRQMSDEYKDYANAFFALDKIIDAFSPVFDATFRCADNEGNPALYLTDDQIALLRNFNNELLKLNISDRFKDEIAFTNALLPSFRGRNIKQAYESLILAHDSNLN